MDLKQRKLSKSEWVGIEIPVSKTESEILRLITDGFSNVHLKVNKTDSIFTHLKIEYTSDMEQIEKFLYVKFFADKIKSLVEQYEIPFIRFDKKHATNDNGVYYMTISPIVRLKSCDQIRLSRLTPENVQQTKDMYEFVLYNHLEQMVRFKHTNLPIWMKHYYTLHRLLQNTIKCVNPYIVEIAQTFLKQYESDVNLLYVVEHAVDIIEKNPDLLKYKDLSLYDHQKDIYSMFATKTKPKIDDISPAESTNTELLPKLILYIAPTGTGKTLTPLGLSQQYKIIFVCAARHVGLALARSAISVGKRVAFAFGCSAAEDVRLHYFAAKEFTRDKRSGQIRKVDNTVGNKVEIIICDIRSYLPAMFYMLSFNEPHQLITYWDEPTIALDYSSHELHTIIKKNWKQNIIPNMVLSSATLPKMHELVHTIADFKNKFPNAVVSDIISHDCRKTIPLINNDGYVVMPHYLHENYQKIQEVVSHCEENLSLLRYFDLKEVSSFIHYIETQVDENNKSVGYTKNSAKFERNFGSVDEIDMGSIKLYYLKVLKNIIPKYWTTIYNYFKLSRTRRIEYNNTIDPKGNIIMKTTSVGSVMHRSNPDEGKCIRRGSSVQEPTSNSKPMLPANPPGSCGIYVTTKDSYLLTDGPTIFLANDLQKIAKFCIQQSNIPIIVMNDIMEKIEFNNQINQKLIDLEKDLEFEEMKMTSKLSGITSDTSKEAKKIQGKKSDKSNAKVANKLVNKTEDRKISAIKENIANLKSMIKQATLDDMFIPNRLAHLAKWANGLNTSHSFTSNIDEECILSIMTLNDVDDSWKILLLLGIGVFTEHKSSSYTEIMKKLADQQKLYLIIADSDYIYGTNYQFCHGYLSKDLSLTQEKIIQALGRIGRNNIQQEYSARFRDDDQITTLFTRFASEEKPEVINMNKLLNSKNVEWNGTNYIEVEEDLEKNENLKDDTYEDLTEDLDEYLKEDLDKYLKEDILKEDIDEYTDCEYENK
jgi:hypothetical protein